MDTREERIEHEMRLGGLTAQGEWIVAEAIEKLEKLQFNPTLIAYTLFLHGVLPSINSMDPYDQAEILEMMDRYNVEKLSDLIIAGLDVSKTAFAKSDEERGL